MLISKSVCNAAIQINTQNMYKRLGTIQHAMCWHIIIGSDDIDIVSIIILSYVSCSLDIRMYHRPLYLQVATVNVNDAQSHNRDNSSKRNLKALKNLSMIMSLFIVCWGPFMTHSVVCVRNPAFCLEHPIIKLIYFGALVLFLANSVVNPIVYAVRFRSFNVAFRLMFGCVKEDERHALMETI